MNFLRKLLAAFIFLLSRFSFMDTNDSHDSRRREGTIFYSTLQLPTVHEHSDIYLHLCMRDDYHIFLIAPLVFTGLLLHLIPPYRISIWLIDDAMSIFVCSLEDFILGFCYSNLTRVTGELKLASTITIIQAKWLTKCASYPFSYIILALPDFLKGKISSCF